MPHPLCFACQSDNGSSPCSVRVPYWFASDTSICSVASFDNNIRGVFATPFTAHCLQVGNLSTESRYWGYPEANTNTRPSYYVPTTIGTSDLTASMSAAFAASSLAFQDTDKAYAQASL